MRARCFRPTCCTDIFTMFSSLPMSHGGVSRAHSYVGNILQSSGAVRSNSGPQWYQRQAHPVAGWLACEITGHRSTHRTEIPIANAPCELRDAIVAKLWEYLPDGDTEKR